MPKTRYGLVLLLDPRYLERQLGLHNKLWELVQRHQGSTPKPEVQTAVSNQFRYLQIEERAAGLHDKTPDAMSSLVKRWLRAASVTENRLRQVIVPTSNPGFRRDVHDMTRDLQSQFFVGDRFVPLAHNEALGFFQMLRTGYTPGKRRWPWRHTIVGAFDHASLPCVRDEYDGPQGDLLETRRLRLNPTALHDRVEASSDSDDIDFLVKPGKLVDFLRDPFPRLSGLHCSSDSPVERPDISQYDFIHVGTIATTLTAAAHGWHSVWMVDKLKAGRTINSSVFTNLDYRHFLMINNLHDLIDQRPQPRVSLKKIGQAWHAFDKYGPEHATPSPFASEARKFLTQQFARH